MTKAQVIKTLKKMRIADDVEFKYCNVLKSYEVRVYYNDKIYIGRARRREQVPSVAEKLYCLGVERSY